MHRCKQLVHVLGDCPSLEVPKGIKDSFAHRGQHTLAKKPGCQAPEMVGIDASNPNSCQGTLVLPNAGRVLLDDNRYTWARTTPKLMPQLLAAQAALFLF